MHQQQTEDDEQQTQDEQQHMLQQEGEWQNTHQKQSYQVLPVVVEQQQMQQ